MTARPGAPNDPSTSTVRYDEPTGRQLPRKAAFGLAALLVVVGALVWVGLATRLPVSAPRARTVAASPYVPPHPLPPGTSYVRTRVLSSGDLRVTHWIASRAPVGSVRLARPTLAGLPPLSVSRVVVVGDGVPAVHDSPAPYAYNLGGARAVYVSYVLQGVLTHAPQQHDRALALVTNLRVTGLPRLTTVMHAVVGRHILNLACSPATPDAVATPCGASGGHGWRVTLLGPAVDERVMAQLDLAGSTQP